MCYPPCMFENFGSPKFRSLSYGHTNKKHPKNCYIFTHAKLRHFNTGVTNPAGLDVTVFWEQGFGPDGLLDNSTCGYEEDITIECDPNGHEPEDTLFDNIANNFHASGSSINYQVQWGTILNNLISLKTES